MTSALALARHRLVNERRDGPRWAQALREGAAEKRRRSRAVQVAMFEIGTSDEASFLGVNLLDPAPNGWAAWPVERERGMPVPWRILSQEGGTP